MHNFGIMAGKNDIFSTMFMGAINRMLRSQLATAGLLILMANLATALLWNAGVDWYVISHGKRVKAAVVSETYHNKSGFSTRYRYPGAGLGNPMHFLDSFFLDKNGPSDIGIANTFGMLSGCNPRQAMLTVAYLPENPRVHAVVENRGVFVFFLIGTLCMIISGALLWNFVRLGRGEPSMALPAWQEGRGY